MEEENEVRVEETGMDYVGVGTKFQECQGLEGEEDRTGEQHASLLHRVHVSY